MRLELIELVTFQKFPLELAETNAACLYSQRSKWDEILGLILL